LKDDKFIECMMSLRQVADHRVHRTGASVPLFLTRASIPLSVETSAGSIFADRRVPFPNPKTKELFFIDHLELLQQAESVLRNGLQRALIQPSWTDKK
jgi:hypothetical protein